MCHKGFGDFCNQDFFVFNFVLIAEHFYNCGVGCGKKSQCNNFQDWNLKEAKCENCASCRLLLGTVHRITQHMSMIRATQLEFHIPNSNEVDIWFSQRLSVFTVLIHPVFTPPFVHSFSHVLCPNPPLSFVNGAKAEWPLCEDWTAMALVKY